jgi:ribosomal protein S18 acetylase RimI-like enzyme
MWLPRLLAALVPALAEIGVPLPTRGYRVGQIGPHEVLQSAGVINRCFFAGSREGPHRTELIGNGLAARMGSRLERGGIQCHERDSLVLGVVPADGCEQIVAIAELSMQPRNGQVPSTFRPTVFPGNEPMVPYLCNLAVDLDHRNQGLARSIMGVCEEVTRTVWGFGEIFLHVDERNRAAARLYASLGYEPLPHWDAPAWKEENLGLVPFRYHRKIVSLDPEYRPYADSIDAAAERHREAGLPAPTLGFAVH